MAQPHESRKAVTDIAYDNVITDPIIKTGVLHLLTAKGKYGAEKAQFRNTYHGALYDSGMVGGAPSGGGRS